MRLVRLARLLGFVPRLPAAERGLALLAAARLLQCWLQLRYPRWLRGHLLAAREWERREATSEGVDRDGLARRLALFRAVQQRLPFAATCLPRALALRLYLRDQGIASCLRLGLSRRDGQLVGHAWLEHAGIPLNTSVAVAISFSRLEGGDTLQ